MESNFNIVTRLHRHAEKQPNHLALIQSGTKHDTQLSYAQLSSHTNAYAHFFSAHGVGKQDHVLLLIPPSPDFYAIFLALMQLGCTLMLIDPGVGKKHIKACLQMLKPSVLIGTPKAQLLRLYPELRHKLKAFCTHAFPFAYKLKPESKDVCTKNANIYAAQENHPALITFTSGSTGRPKAIVRTHGFLLRQGDELARLMHAPADTIEFATFPVFVLANLSQGITTVLPPSNIKTLATADFPSIAKCIEKHHVTRLLAAPDFCNRLALTPNAQTTLRTIEHIHTGGGPVHINVLANLKKVMPQATIIALYGSTEAEPIALQNLSTSDPAMLQAIAHGAGLPAGKPVDIIQLRIIKDQTGCSIPPLTQEAFERMTLQENQTGEIVVTGPLVQKGYMNKADNQETKFEVKTSLEADNQTWHRTGDAGYLDENGTLWLQGRSSAKIRINEQWVYPFAVEAAAAMHPQIRRAAFIQIKNKNILVLEGQPLQPQEEKELKQNLPYLHQITYLQNIPVDKRHHTKVLYKQLEEMLLNA